jgi:uncharacterized radical SAM superfamily protein
LDFDILTDGRTILEASAEELEQWMQTGLQKRFQMFGKDLFCYSPTAYPYKIPDHEHTCSHSFISLSVTGTSCSLMCEHCEGRLLKGMVPAQTPEALLQQCSDVHAKGGEGVLISGGSDSQGYVPLKRFLKTIGKVKRDLGLQVVVHTGLVDEETAQGLGKAAIDAAMLDIIGDASVSEQVYHLKDGPKNMDRSLDILSQAGIPIVPHVLVGLNYGKLGGEIEALEMISKHNPDALVIIALSPVRKTAMDGIDPPTPTDIGRIMTVARLGLEKTPLLLGCARPIGNHKIESDKYAVRCGVNGVAYISQEGVDTARSIGLRPVFEDVCCSLVYQVVTGSV